MRLAQQHRARQSPPQLAQAKPALETVRGFRQAEARVLALPDRVIAAADGARDVAQQYVDPSRSRILDPAAGATAVRHQYDPLGACIGRVRMIGLGPTAEAEQPIRVVRLGARRQMARLPVLLELHEIDRHGVCPRRRGGRHRPAALSQIARPGAEVRAESGNDNRSVVLRPQLARCDC